MITKSVLLVCSLGFLIVASAYADEPYHFIKEIPVGGEGGWDYLTVDSVAHRLYVSHATKVEVIDEESGQIVGEITNTIGVHGIALAPKFNRGFVSDGRANQVSIFDLRTLQTLATVATGKNPDCIMAGPKQAEIYAFNGKDHSASVIATDTGSVVATIPLDGKPEFAQLDAKAGRMFDNIEDKSEVAVIDTTSHQVLTNWPETPGESASGLAIDRKAHHLFLGCDNQMMVMMDDQTGKVLATVPIGEGVDANTFDPETKLAFASCGDGTTTIAREDGDSLTVVQTLKTERGARTMALDSKTHEIFLATAKMMAGSQPGEHHGKAVPGTFKILVYGLK